jgi:hypothetical protein
MPPIPCHTNFVERETHQMFDELWSEIQDAPGEIFDIPEMQDSKDFNLDEYLKGDYDY